MKILKTLSGLAAGVATCALLCQPAVGAVNLGQLYTANLPSTVTPNANIVTVQYEVLSVGTVISPKYEYMYQVFDGGNNINVPNTIGEPGATSLDVLSLSFNGAAGSITDVPNAQAPTVLNTTSVKWVLNQVLNPPFDSSPAPGFLGGAASPGFLAFYSTYPPVLYNADATDANPPSPFSSTAPGGYQVAVPNAPPPPQTPDGGMTLSLLGFALMGIEGLRRKLAK